MLERGFEQFAGKRILLLQGPVGPFFAALAQALREVGAEVFKINFNGGDWLFYPYSASNYRGSMADWPAWLRRFLTGRQIGMILLFGDCRPVHRAAHAVADQLGVEIGVFEEGYIRPNYVTFEPHGVNGHSSLPRDPDYYRGRTLPVPAAIDLGSTYGPMAWAGFRYFLAGILGKPVFRHYRHHREIAVREGLPWIRSLWRKWRYAVTERHLLPWLLTQHYQRYYLVPLQVFDDTQVAVHGRFSGVEQFIASVLASFALHADKNTLLVYKHHPMDRGHRDYSALIRRHAASAGCAARVLYLHDQPLPALLPAARGVVVMNSTVGLSALHHGVPVKACSVALYDMPGLTYQGDLDSFWNAEVAAPEPGLYADFRRCLLAHTQLNGSYYKALRQRNAIAGLIWARRTDN